MSPSIWLNDKKKANLLTCCRQTGVGPSGLSRRLNSLCFVCWWSEAYYQNIPEKGKRQQRFENTLTSEDPQRRSDGGLTSQRNMNMPMWSCSSLVTLRARLSVLPSGSNSSSRLSAPFLSWVHTSISSWQYANVQFSPYWHSCRSCTSAGRWGLDTLASLWFWSKHFNAFFSMCVYLYKEQTLQGSCCELAEVLSSSTSGLLCFSDGTAGHPSCSGARPPADIYNPSPVDLGTERRNQMLHYTLKLVSAGILHESHYNKAMQDKTKGPGLTYSTVAGVTSLSKFVWGRQRIPGQQRQVGSRWTILKEK